MNKFVFVAPAIKRAGPTKEHPHIMEEVSVHTDGLTIHSMHEPGWPAAYRFEQGKRYRITIEELPPKTSLPFDVGDEVRNIKGWVGRVVDIVSAVPGNEHIYVSWGDYNEVHSVFNRYGDYIMGEVDHPENYKLILP